MILNLIKNQTHEITIETPIVINYLEILIYFDVISKKKITISKIDFNTIDLRCNDGNILKKIK